MPQPTPSNPTPPHSPRVEVRVVGEHVMTVAAMPLGQQHASPDEIKIMQEAIRQAEATAIAEAKAKHGQPT